MAASINAVALNRKYCRKYEGMARCVDEPLMVDDEDLWCPYRVCGPSYVAAPECPETPEQATHKCKVTTLDTPIHRCIEGKTHKIVKLPLGCDETEDDEGDVCIEDARVCACEQASSTRTVLSPEFKITPLC